MNKFNPKMMSQPFAPGDIVERIGDSWADMRIGSQHVVKHHDANRLLLEGWDSTWSGFNFKLVKRASEMTQKYFVFPRAILEKVVAEMSIANTADFQTLKGNGRSFDDLGNAEAFAINKVNDKNIEMLILEARYIVKKKEVPAEVVEIK